MTKRVRVEDADQSAHKVVVQTWDKSASPDHPDVMASETELSGPTDLRDFYIHGSRYLVVKEA